ncbi:MAG TPA: hypothetical protein VMT73_14855 [Anaerolineales bacterium]|nr:hypothetical protein [Anaerolineales bacterium]
MYTLYNNLLPEKRDAWRNAYEIKMAALEHEKRRLQNFEDSGLGKPQALKGGQRSGWSAIFRASSRLLALLIG